MHRSLRFAVYLVCALLLSGCMLRPGRGFNKNKKFNSPLRGTPAMGKDLTSQQIFQQLQARNGRVDTVRANFDLVAGGGIRGKQIINAMLFMQAPGFMRVRGSQNEGTLFDVLINRDSVQMLSYPDQKFYRGTMQQLQQNPDLLNGLQPTDLMEYLPVEQTLLKRLQAQQFPQEQVDGHYQFRFQKSDGTSELFHVRKEDLLVDRVERFHGERLLSRIHYWAYDYFSTSYLLPTDFVIELPDKKGEFAIKVTMAQVNNQVTPELQRLQVPEGFERMAIGR